MEQNQIQLAEAVDPNRLRLLEIAQAMVLRGDKEFTIADLCGEAGVERDVFHDHFAGKTALLAALMRDYPVGGSKAAVKPVAASGETKSETPAMADASQNAPQDEWFERRLRVFERALTALEAKAEATAREQARVIAELQARLNDKQVEPVADAPSFEEAPIQAASPLAQVHSLEPIPEAVTQAEMPVLDEVINAPAQAAVQDIVTEEAKPEIAAPVASSSAIGDALPGVRNFPDFEALLDEKRPKAKINPRMRLMALAAGLLVAAFVSVGFLLGRNLLDDAQARPSDAVAHRQVARTTLHKTIALADAGDARAQARLALAYLRGQGSAADADAALLWCMSAARSGNPVAQYVLGALYQQGDHVAADPVEAVKWFSAAAAKGNLKAMHNLAIAYAQGLGTPKDEAKAAEWFTRAAERGYIDSAFDLAVLFERGEGVPQDLKQALKWYGIAALAGDQPSKERGDFLRGQMKAPDIKLATNAAMAFAPLPAAEDANSL